MRVFLSGVEFEGFRQRLERDGHEVVESSTKADLALVSSPTSSEFRPVSGQRVVYGGVTLPRLSLQAAGLAVDPVVEQRQSLFTLSRWFDQNGWREDLDLFGVPLVGLMNEGLGAPVEVGWVGHPSKDSCLFEHFHNPVLGEIFKKFEHRGFVTIRTTREGVVECHTGLPRWAGYAAGEGVKGGLAEWCEKPSPFLDSWTAALLVSRWPWPAEAKGDEAEVGSPLEAERHVWRLGRANAWTEARTKRTEVLVVSSWAKDLSEATWRALRTCRNLTLPCKQYRTDSRFHVEALVKKLREEGFEP